MPSPLELLNPPETPDTAEAHKLVRGTVLEVDGSLLRVDVPLLNRAVIVEHWSGDPQVGDLVLLAIDDDGDEWLVAIA